MYLKYICICNPLRQAFRRIPNASAGRGKGERGTGETCERGKGGLVTHGTCGRRRGAGKGTGAPGVPTQEKDPAGKGTTLGVLI
jgi:hypothetical protein